MPKNWKYVKFLGKSHRVKLIYNNAFWIHTGAVWYYPSIWKYDCLHTCDDVTVLNVYSVVGL